MPTALTDAHRTRLHAAGVDPEALAGLELTAHVAEPLDGWWTESGNTLYLADGIELPRDELLQQMLGLPYSDALIVLASPSDHLVSLLVSDDSTLFVGPDCDLMAGEIFCGAGSTIVLQGMAIGTRSPRLDARNGGSIIAGRDQLWAADVYIATDDMHRLEDLATGARLNPFGAHIWLGEHVWLCREATVTGHAEIGSGSVIGQRSLVRGQKVAPNTAVAGAPARVIREGVTWSPEDLP